jgi:hypothetical protein
MAELPSSHPLSKPGRREATAAGIEAVYGARASEFLRVATAIAGSREGGRDAVQEALTRAFARRTTFRGTGTVEAWLWKAVVNSARNVRDRSPRVAEGADADAAAHDGSTSGATRFARPWPPCPSGSGSLSFSATTPISTTPRSRPRSASDAAPSRRP